MKKTLLTLTVCLALLAGLTLVPAASSAAEPLKVSVTFDAIREFVLSVGGDKVEVSVIIPPGSEAHSFEPKAQDLVALGSAQIFVYNGLGMESWAEQAIAAVNNPELIAVDASTGAALIERSNEQGQANNAEAAQAQGKYDPHLWLSPSGAKIEAANIRDALVTADPESAAYYEANYAAFAAQLDALIAEYQAKIAPLARRSFVTGHAAFGYLCRDFGLNQNSVQDVFAEGEPSAQQLVQLVQYCRDNSVTTIFSEELASPEVSATLASEVGAKVETIYTMESAEDNLTYVERMQSNMEKIVASLAD